MEQIATFMGHTKKTHAEFYRLPQDLFQTAKVAKILLLMEKGRGKEFKGKSLNEIELQKDVYYSSESEIEDEEDEATPLSETALKRATASTSMQEDENNIFNTQNAIENIKRKKSVTKRNSDLNKELDINNKKTKSEGNKKSGRLPWTEAQKKLVLNHFKKHIKNKVTPKKHECEELIVSHKDILGSKDWVRVKTLVYNTFRMA
ncbi:hypothetical protein Zmor_003240 [Zophobas morio]|uniref:Uncharacterized protein n=1 Tax=Zophobas morio TaxID=2755281 RepID=A0AA38HMP0_9CUCU|nr:hypothetical protein Zmor_003240 [Zophobas morio]